MMRSPWCLRFLVSLTSFGMNTETGKSWIRKNKYFRKINFSVLFFLVF